MYYQIKKHNKHINIALIFISQSYFSVPKDVRLNCTNFMIFKIHNRKKLQQIAIDHSEDIDYKDFLKIYGDCTKEPYHFLNINTILPINERLKRNIFDPLL